MPYILTSGTVIRSNIDHTLFHTGQKLGSGSFGTVYEVTAIQSNRVFAIKVAISGRSDSSYRKEVAILSDLVPHLNVIRFLGTASFRINRMPMEGYLMEKALCSLKDFYRDFVSRRLFVVGTLTQSVAYQMLEALAHLASERILHRDVKPENILVVETEDKANVIFKLSDFGLATSMYDYDGSGAGSLFYMAPEVRQRRVQAGHKDKIDIYALGKVLEQMLTGGIARLDPFARRPTNAVPIDVDSEGLVDAMMREDATRRPTAARCLQRDWVRRGSRVIITNPHNRRL